MRGDSLRDLYAKTMALVGLGMLAGAGALVDYWPAGVAVPEVASELQRPSATPSLAPPAADSIPTVQAVSFESSEARPPYRSGPIMVSRPSAVLTLDEPESVDAAMPAPDIHVVQPQLDLAAGPFRYSGVSVGLTQPPIQTIAVASTTSIGPQDSKVSSGGFFEVAFKKTGASILRTGKRTGVSIVDAVRGLSGAVRKALPSI